MPVRIPFSRIAQFLAAATLFALALSLMVFTPHSALWAFREHTGPLPMLLAILYLGVMMVTAVLMADALVPKRKRGPRINGQD